MKIKSGYLALFVFMLICHSFQASGQDSSNFVFRAGMGLGVGKPMEGDAHDFFCPSAQLSVQCFKKLTICLQRSFPNVYIGDYIIGPDIAHPVFSRFDMASSASALYTVSLPHKIDFSLGAGGSYFYSDMAIIAIYIKPGQGSHPHPIFYGISTKEIAPIIKYSVGYPLLKRLQVSCNYDLYCLRKLPWTSHTYLSAQYTFLAL